MIFKPMPQMVKDLDVWGSERDGFTFMISMDHQYNDEIRASVKAMDATPFDKARIDLGVFNSLQEAIDACTKWRPTYAS